MEVKQTKTKYKYSNDERETAVKQIMRSCLNLLKVAILIGEWRTALLISENIDLLYNAEICMK